MFAKQGFLSQPQRSVLWASNMRKSEAYKVSQQQEKLLAVNGLRAFMNRHEGLTLKSPKLLSVYRAKCANRDLYVLNGWFDIYEEKGIVSPVNIWNVDECGYIDTPEPKQIICPVKVRPNQLCALEK